MTRALHCADDVGHLLTRPPAMQEETPERSASFEPWQLIDDYVKPIGSRLDHKM